MVLLFYGQLVYRHCTTLVSQANYMHELYAILGGGGGGDVCYAPHLATNQEKSLLMVVWWSWSCRL